MKTSHSFALRMTVIACAWFGTGCATVGTRVAHVERTTVARRTRIDPTEFALVAMETSADKLRFDIRPACRIVDVGRVHEVTTYERFNESVGLDLSLGVLGALALGTGAWAIADAGNVGATTSSARVYNPVGADMALAGGAGLAAVGAGLLAIPIADWVRSSGTHVGHREFETDGDELAKDVECERGNPLDGFVGVRVNDGIVVVGLGVDAGTPAEIARIGLGTTELTLSRVIPDVLERAPARPEVASILVGSTVVGRTVMTDAYNAADDARWELLRAARRSCERPSSLNDCSSVEAEAVKYPASRHAIEARALVRSAEPAFASIREAEAKRREEEAKRRMEAAARAEEQRQAAYREELRRARSCCNGCGGYFDEATGDCRILNMNQRDCVASRCF
jgi:hypothetical protein